MQKQEKKVKTKEQKTITDGQKIHHPDCAKYFKQAVRNGDVQSIKQIAQKVRPGYEEAQDLIQQCFEIVSDNDDANTLSALLDVRFDLFPSYDPYKFTRQFTENGQLDMVKMMVENNLYQRPGTLINRATEKGHHAITKYLLNKFDYNDDELETAYANALGHEWEFIQIFLDAGVSPGGSNARRFGGDKTVFTEAFEAGGWERIEKLIEYKSFLNEHVEEIRKAALKDKRYDIVRTCYKNGATFDGSGSSYDQSSSRRHKMQPVIQSCSRIDRGLIEIYEDGGVKPPVDDAGFKTDMAKKGAPDTFEYLANKYDFSLGSQEFYLSAKEAEPSTVAGVIEHAYSPSQSVAQKGLAKAITNNTRDVVFTLYNKTEADLVTASRAGVSTDTEYTPVQWALANKKADMLEWFIKQGVSPDTDALGRAIESEKVGCLDVLLRLCPGLVENIDSDLAQDMFDSDILCPIASHHLDETKQAVYQI